MMMTYLKWTLIILLLAYLAVCLFYFLFQKRFIFVRYGLSGKYKFKLDADFKEIILHSPDNESLHAIHMYVEEPKGLLIYFHGNTGSLKRWAKIAATFTEYGYDVLAPDYRGYGKSTGSPSEKFLIKDAEQFYRYALEHYNEEKIVLYGRSLGSGVAVQLAQGKKARLLMLETPFASLMDVVKSLLPFLPFKYLLKEEFNSFEYINNVDMPIVIMAGSKDSLVPYRSSVRLFSRISKRENAFFYTFKQGEHNTLASFRKFHRVMDEYL